VIGGGDGELGGEKSSTLPNTYRKMMKNTLSHFVDRENSSVATLKIGGSRKALLRISSQLVTTRTLNTYE